MQDANVGKGTVRRIAELINRSLKYGVCNPS